MSEDSQELIECPRSLDLWERGEATAVHRAPGEEIAANRGVCAKCAAELKRRHWSVRTGRPENPGDMHTTEHRVWAHKEHVAFGESGEHTPSIDFDFEAVYALDEQAKTSPAAARETALVLFTRLLLWVWGRPGRKSDRDMRGALTRLAAFTCGLRPDLLGNATLTEIGQELGCSKQLLSQSSLRCAEVFGTRFARNRPDAARANMRRAMLNSHRRRKGSTPPD
jgi:hypothetical protein